MTKPRWYSQPFRPDGGISAEGLRNQLGRPNLSLLTVLVREAAQNSWDARVEDVVDFRLDLGEVNVSKLPAWRDLLGSGIPAGELDNFPLRSTIRKQSITYLAVSDRGTAGLGGPTRSDEATAPGENRNWLSFVLNSGDQQDADGGGGTYGYGKGVFFLASKVGTVLIHTRFRGDDGELHTRLIGSTLMSSYTFQDTPLTGRHWWGHPAADHCEPLVDDDAQAAVAALGLPGFRSGRTGTTVVVIEPNLADPTVPEEQSDELDLREAGRYLAEAAAWNLWPLTLAGRKTRMEVRVTGGGLDVPIPSEENDPTLYAFAAAYRAAAGADAEPSMCLRPKRRLGNLGHQNTFGAEVTAFAAREHGLEGAPHHFAMMRRPDLVVSYYEGPAKLSPEVGYAGVFKVADDLNDVFAEAEPPTHDAWVDTQLRSREATFVRVARLRLKETTAEIAGARIASTRAQAVAVGSLSQRLGHLMSGPGAIGTVLGSLEPSLGSNPERGDDSGVTPRAPEEPSAGSSSGEGGRPSQRSKRPVLLGEPVYEVVMDRYMVRQRVSLGPGNYRGLCQVVTGDGTHETEQPVGAEAPAVFAWRVGNSVRRGDTCAIDEAGEFDLLIDPVADVVFDINVVEVVE